MLPEEILDGENSDVKAVQMYLSNITKKVTFFMACLSFETATGYKQQIPFFICISSISRL
jgi:hypothetical protein